MINYEEYLISHDQPLSIALKAMNDLSNDLTLFVINEESQLVGTLTDGDARRGLIEGLNVSDSVMKFMNHSFFYVKVGEENIFDLISARERNLKIIPVLDGNGQIAKLINFSFYYSYLPIDVFIMAGGEGIRLRPLTENIPKPLLKVGEKPILEHLIDRLVHFGVTNFQISINYLGDKISSYFKNGADKNVSIQYIIEDQKMGTAGSISKAEIFKNDHVMIINSDLLTNVNFEDFYLDFLEKDADMSIACVPYTVNIPYAILDVDGAKVNGLKEKPTYNYVGNAGIYLIKKKYLARIPKNSYYNATDLIEDLIKDKLNVSFYTILDYWLDIGKMDDFHKAQRDIQHIKF
jgi:dTDP-glucose pyrophosphorylase